MNKQNMFDLLKQIPTANQSVIEKLEGLEPDNREMFEPNRLIVDYFWYFPDGKVRSQITLDWCPKEKLMYVCAHWNSSPEFHVELAYRSGVCSYLYQNSIKGRELTSDPEEFWACLECILDAEEGSTSQKTAF